jgi:ERO1-like protein alpha
LKNIEAYTGYQGRQIWNAIYNENCFADRLTKICQEDKILYTIISGLHSNINIHLSYNYFDTKHQESENNPRYQNMSMLNERVLSHKDRLQNLFFLYGTLLK